MVDMTLIRPLNKGQSFILVPIDFSYATSYRLSIVTFALDAPYDDNRLTTDGRNTDISATFGTVG